MQIEVTLFFVGWRVNQDQMTIDIGTRRNIRKRNIGVYIAIDYPKRIGPKHWQSTTDTTACFENIVVLRAVYDLHSELLSRPNVFDNLITEPT